MAKLSSYAKKLSQEAKDRYIHEISTIDRVVPFSGVAISCACSATLSAIAFDLVSYLVL